MAGRGSKVIFFLLYIAFGIYFINAGFNFWPFLVFAGIEKWIKIVAGLLIVLGGINYWRITPSY